MEKVLSIITSICIILFIAYNLSITIRLRKKEKRPKLERLPFQILSECCKFVVNKEDNTYFCQNCGSPCDKNNINAQLDALEQIQLRELKK